MSSLKKGLFRSSTYLLIGLFVLILLKIKLLLLLSYFGCVRLCVTPQRAAHQAPPSLGFSRQEHWSGLPFPSPMHACMLSRFSCVQLCVTLWTAAHQPPLSMGFSRQEYWRQIQKRLLQFMSKSLCFLLGVL